MTSASNPMMAPAAAQPGRTDYPLFVFLWRCFLLGGVALLPFMMWRFHPDIQFTLSDGCFAIALMFGIMTGRLNLSYLGGLTPWWILSFTLMIAALGASSLIYGEPYRFGVTGSQYLFAYLILPFLVLVSDPRELLRVVMVFAAAIIAVEAFSVAMFYYHGQTPLSLEWINHNFVTGAGRLGSFFGSANRNAAVISLTLPFVLYFARCGLWPVWIAVGGIAVLAVAQILTASVTGLVSGLCAIGLFVVAAYGRQSWKVVAVCAALVLMAWSAGLSLPEAFQNRVLTAFSSGDIEEAGSYTGRMELVEESFELSDDVNLLGIGSDQFRAVSEEGAPVHNIYLLMWVEGGPFALLGWLLAMGIFAWIGLRTFVCNRTAGALVLSVGVAFLIISNASTHIYARMWVIPILFAARIGVLCMLQTLQNARQATVESGATTA